MRVVNPPGWPTPKGYSNAISARGRLVFVAGQVGWRPDGTWESDDFAAQFRQALANTVAALAAAGANPTDIARMTIYVTDKHEYVRRSKDVGAVWRELIGRHYPAMTLVEVRALLEDRAKLEIETTAVVADGDE
ncbi:MAG: RidA family protein [Rhodospirillales bacterium]|nr:RidA family protein [Rhodospirillales bacterium]